MKTSKIEITKAETHAQDRVSGFFGEVTAFISRDGEYLTILLPGNMRVRKHVNFFKAAMKVPFTPKRTQAYGKNAS